MCGAHSEQAGLLLVDDATTHSGRVWLPSGELLVRHRRAGQLVQQPMPLHMHRPASSASWCAVPTPSAAVTVAATAVSAGAASRRRAEHPHHRCACTQESTST